MARGGDGRAEWRAATAGRESPNSRVLGVSGDRGRGPNAARWSTGHGQSTRSNGAGEERRRTAQAENRARDAGMVERESVDGDWRVYRAFGE